MLIIMRGLPWTGKSYRAKQLAGDSGIICSTDDYFYQVIKPEQPDVYNFNPRFLSDAHKWNYLRTRKAVEKFVKDGSPTPIIVDNTNTESWEPQGYVKYAIAYSIPIEIHEPTSDRWLEICELLKDKKSNKKALKDWAVKLAEGSKETHNVHAFAIEKMIWRWQCDITIDDILNASKPH